MQPRVKGRIAPKRLQPTIGFEECILYGVFCVGKIFCVPHREVHDALTVFADQRVECTAFTGFGPQYESSIAALDTHRQFQFRRTSLAVPALRLFGL